MLKVGLTGGIGSGKSTIAKIIETIGFPVFYSDFEAKNIVNSNLTIRNSLIELFGPDIYCQNILDRQRLSQIIFNKPDQLQIVNGIIHPEVRKKFHEWSESQEKRLVFNEAAILFETGAYKQFDKNILVSAPKSVRIQRVMARDRVPYEDVEKRIGNQWDDEVKIPLSDYIIINDNFTPVLIQVERILQDLIALQ